MAQLQTRTLNSQLNSALETEENKLKLEEEQQKTLQQEMEELHAKQSVLAKEVKQMRAAVESSKTTRDLAKEQFIAFQERLRNLTQ